MPAPPSRLATVDVLRGVAALAVSWFHFTNGNQAFLADGWLKHSGAYGWLGVEVFFVISGFIIPLSLDRGGYRLHDFGTFVLKRVLRLDPPYIAAIVVILGLGWLSAQLPGFRGQPQDVSLAQVLLHLGYVNVFFGYPWLSPVFWTLALELQYYLAIGLLFPLAIARRETMRAVVIVALASLGFVFPAEPFLFRWLPLFGVGIAVFELHTSRLGASSCAAAVACCAVSTALLHGAIVAIVVVGTGMLIAFATLPARGPLGWLGKVSYSLYLLHVPIGGRVVNFGERFDLSVWMQGVVLVAAVAASLLAAWLLYALVEQPAQRWSSRLKYRRAAGARVPAGAQVA
jgi:peptidoglycan/LPS O-acetylase OafA/YrhL